MTSLVRDVMTTEVVTVQPWTPFRGDDVIVRDFMMDPSRFFIDVVDGVVVLQGRIERSRLIPFLIRAVHGVEGVVRVEDRLIADVNDRDADLVMAYPRMRA